jgi:hypothetical protein
MPTSFSQGPSLPHLSTNRFIAKRSKALSPETPFHGFQVRPVQIPVVLLNPFVGGRVPAPERYGENVWHIHEDPLEVAGRGIIRAVRLHMGALPQKRG